MASAAGVPLHGGARPPGDAPGPACRCSIGGSASTGTSTRERRGTSEPGWWEPAPRSRRTSSPSPCPNRARTVRTRS